MTDIGEMKESHLHNAVLDFFDKEKVAVEKSFPRNLLKAMSGVTCYKRLICI